MRSLVLAPVLAIYILIDLKRFKEGALDATPPKYREESAFVAGQVGTALGSFVRGQLLVSVIVGIASSIGMWLIDLPFWLIIGILAGFLNLIPFLGPIVGGALAVLVALLNGDPSQAVWAVVIFVVIQQVDNHVITPLVQRARVNLSPLVICPCIDHRRFSCRATRCAGGCPDNGCSQNRRRSRVAYENARRVVA